MDSVNKKVNRRRFRISGINPEILRSVECDPIRRGTGGVSLIWDSKTFGEPVIGDEVTVEFGGADYLVVGRTFARQAESQES